MTQSPQEKLAACPFCGNGNTLMVEHVEGTVLHPAYYVRCDNCGAIGPTTDNGGHADLWNSRPATLLSEHGEVVVTTDESGRCVAVTRQDSEGRILSTIWEAPEHGGGGEAEPVTWMVTAGDGYEVHNVRSESAAKRIYAELVENGWQDAKCVPLYTTPPTPSAPVVDDASIIREAADLLTAVSDSGVQLPESWRWPLIDELRGIAAASEGDQP